MQKRPILVSIYIINTIFSTKFVLLTLVDANYQFIDNGWAVLGSLFLFTPFQRPILFCLCKSNFKFNVFEMGFLESYEFHRQGKQLNHLFHFLFFT